MVSPDWLARSMAAFAIACAVRLPDAPENPLWFWATLITALTWLAISLTCLIMWKIQK